MIIEENNTSKKKIIQLGNHSRKTFGLPLDVEAGNPTTFTERLLREVFAVDMVGTGPVISVAHHTGPEKNGSRCMIARLHSFEIKRKITQKAAELRSFTYNGKRIWIHSDVSAETMNLRAEFKDIKSELFEHKIRCGFIQPTATLILTFREKVHKFTTAREAEDFFVRYIKNIEPDEEEDVNGASDKDEEGEEKGDVASQKEDSESDKVGEETDMTK